MKTKHLQHVYSRIGFGALPSDIKLFSNFDRRKVVARIMEQSEKIVPLEMDLSDLEALTSEKNRVAMDKKKRMELQKISRKKIEAYNQLWIERLAETDQLLREKMTLFWANVFVCRDNNIFYVQRYNNTLRRHSLGDFRTFVKAIAKEAAMSKYLNNRQNLKERPNENFARELMELFTLGEGNYTEKDIKEAARAFTGWSFKPNGDFYLRQKKHDYGVKTFMGKTGNFEGEDIIDIILEQKQCARFICSKIYRYFIHPEINETRLNELTDFFYKDYDVASLMKYILMTDWFYAEANIGAKIKSPIELLVGILRIVPLNFEKRKQLLYLQKVMGQILFNPPNVAGWLQDKNWIDSNTLLFRMKLPSVLLNNAVIQVNQKGEFEDSFDAYYAKTKKTNRYIKITRNWAIFNREFLLLSDKELREILILSPIEKDTQAFLDSLAVVGKKEYLVQLMSLPEYQLC
jgi:uncharacterized protein (DUF1800 family)